MQKTLGFLLADLCTIDLFWEGHDVDAAEQTYHGWGRGDGVLVCM